MGKNRNALICRKTEHDPDHKVDITEGASAQFLTVSIFGHMGSSRQYRKNSCFVLLLLTFENSNEIKLLQIASNCIRLIIWLK